MAMAVGFDNAIGWAQLQLRRGWRNVLATTIAYLVVVGGLMLASLRLEEYTPHLARTQILQFWTMALMGLQIAVLLLGGCSAIGAAVRKDISSGMIESHRLMNVSGTEAVAGYIFGATCQVLPVAAVNLLLGSFAAGVGFTVHVWLLANVILFVFSLCAWAAMTLLAFVAQTGMRYLVGFVVVLLIGKSILPAVLPGLTMLISPVIRGSVFGIILGRSWHRAYEISILGQCFVGILCFIGAVHKYRRNDVLAFGPLLGLVLVAGWISLSVKAISDWQEFTPSIGGFWYVERVALEGQLIVALLVGMFLATVPISGAAWIQARWRHRRLLNDPALPARPIPTPVVALVAAALPLLLPWLVEKPLDVTAESIVQTFLVMALFLLATSWLIRLLYALEVKRTRVIVGLWFFAAWLGPLGIDLVRAGLEASPTDESMLSPISGCSPIGAFISIWAEPAASADPRAGLAVQAALAAVLAALFYGLQRRSDAGKAPEHVLLMPVDDA